MHLPSVAQIILSHKYLHPTTEVISRCPRNILVKRNFGTQKSSMLNMFLIQPLVQTNLQHFPCHFHNILESEMLNNVSTRTQSFKLVAAQAKSFNTHNEDFFPVNEVTFFLISRE